MKKHRSFPDIEIKMRKGHPEKEDGKDFKLDYLYVKIFEEEIYLSLHISTCVSFHLGSKQLHPQRRAIPIPIRENDLTPRSR